MLFRFATSKTELDNDRNLIVSNVLLILFQLGKGAMLAEEKRFRNLEN